MRRDEQMQAAIRDRYGSIDVVELRDIDEPVPTEDRVLVRVRAASVNRADLDSLGPRPGFARAFMGLRAPRITRMGIDVAGVVEAVGPDATRFQPGDAVFGDLFSYGSGSFAELVCPRERGLEPIPAGMSFETAATLPHSAILALQGLRLRNGRTIRPGDRVLIDGASGNVGPFAVQIAKAMGAEVTGTCRTAKVDFVASIGGDHVIDYTTTDYTRGPDRYDWIVDTDSHHSMLEVRKVLRPGGAYVTLGGTTLPIVAALASGAVLSAATKRWMGLLLWWKPFHRPDVERLAELIASGQVIPRIDRSFPLSDVVAALRWVDDGHALGKVLVIP
jgi:NADPH:quinone reductase-like Zn-dependent oxidoreductase